MILADVDVLDGELEVGTERRQDLFLTRRIDLNCGGAGWRLFITRHARDVDSLISQTGEQHAPAIVVADTSDGGRSCPKACGSDSGVRTFSARSLKEGKPSREAPGPGHSRPRATKSVLTPPNITTSNSPSLAV